MQIGWVDFSEDDRAKALEVMDLYREKRGVDEIGIGVIRDAFANYFFPGITTGQTRAKYFLLVPYILRNVLMSEEKKKSVKNIQEEVKIIKSEIDKEEQECAKKLKEKCPEETGIIGKDALPKSWVTLTPLDRYWSGLQTYGIVPDLAFSKYISAAVKQEQSRKNIKESGYHGNDKQDSNRDDKDAGDLTSSTFWPQNLPTCSGDWKEELSIHLLQKEADFLKAQIIANTKGTLLEYILKNNVNVALYENFEALTEGLSEKVPPEMFEMMKLACDFNDLVYMARIRYNILLLKKNEDTEKKAVAEESVQKKDAVEEAAQKKAALDEWKQMVENQMEKKQMAENQKEYSIVDLKEVFDKLNINCSNNKMNKDTFDFLSELQTHFLAYFKDKDIKHIDAGDDLIKKREKSLKKNLAKLTKEGKQNSDKWEGGRKLDYRFANAKRIIGDIQNYSEEEASNV